MNAKAKIGVFGIGLAAYWPQFPGLKERLEGYQGLVEQRLTGMGADVVSAGLVDNAQAAQVAGGHFARAGVHLIVCYVGTYATSSQVLPVVQRSQAPVLILNLQPVPALNYPDTDTAEWLANCCACCVPEIANAFARSRITFNVVSGLLRPAVGQANRYYERAWDEIGAWVRAANVMQELQRSRIGFLGHTYPGMLDMYSDFTLQHAQLGAHVEVLEMDDLHARVAAVTDVEIGAKLNEIGRTFTVAEAGRDKISQPVSVESLRRSAQIACGLDRLVADFDLNGLTYYYRGLAGNANEELGAGLIVGNSLLTARGVPASGEGDLKTCIAMLIMDRLGAGGSFTEFYAMDFNDDFILMGHDGPGHIAIADGKPVLRGLGLFHGKRGYGLSVEFKVKTGPITILGMTQTAEGRLKMLVAEGTSLPGETLRIGNTNSRLKFGLDPAAFMNRWAEAGATHHCALGIGHHAGALGKLARLMGLELAVIGEPRHGDLS
ncbi:MAG: L-fucose/L-arabinose isomerase family protein [Thermoflexales bacterium]